MSLLSLSGVDVVCCRSSANKCSKHCFCIISPKDDDTFPSTRFKDQVLAQDFDSIPSYLACPS